MPKQKGKPRHSNWMREVAEAYCEEWNGSNMLKGGALIDLLYLLIRAQNRGIRMGRLLERMTFRGPRAGLTRHKLRRRS